MMDRSGVRIHLVADDERLAVKQQDDDHVGDDGRERCARRECKIKPRACKEPKPDGSVRAQPVSGLSPRIRHPIQSNTVARLGSLKRTREDLAADGFRSAEDVLRDQFVRAYGDLFVAAR